MTLNQTKKNYQPMSVGLKLFDDARGRFDVRFYLVAILFIIFDLEVAFLFPWAITLGKIGLFGFWSMMIFLTVLTIGLFMNGKRSFRMGVDEAKKSLMIL